MKQRILFIGNFLSKTRGTIGPVEGVMNYLKDDYTIHKASSYNNQILRLLDMIFKSIFYKYDILHIDVYSGSATFFAFATSLIGKLRGKKIILNLHGGRLFEVYSKSPSSITKLFLRATKIITPSMYLKANFERAGFSIEYLPNSVNLLNFPYKRGRDNNHKLLWVRAFCHTYNPHIAIESLSKILKVYPDATLTMVGPDKGLLNENQKLIDDLGLKDKVHITGKVPNDQLYTYYHSHQVFLTTTSYESFGVALLEAASTGIPIISTSVGEIPYMWENSKSALLINNISSDEMADKIISLLDESNKQVLLADAAHKKSQDFVWEKLRNKWIEILK